MCRYEQGSSIIELMVTITLFFLMAAIAIPGTARLTQSFRASSALDQIEFDLRRARSETISQGATGIVSITQDAAHYTFGIDKLPFGSPPSADQNLFSRELPAKVTFSTSQNIVFNSRGFLIDNNGSVTNTTLTFDYDGQQYCQATISAIGAVTFACP